MTTFESLGAAVRRSQETSTILQSQDVQTTILACVTTGGSIEIEDRTVTVRASGSDTDDDPAMVRLVAALLG